MRGPHICVEQDDLELFTYGYHVSHELPQNSVLCLHGLPNVHNTPISGV